MVEIVIATLVGIAIGASLWVRHRRGSWDPPQPIDPSSCLHSSCPPSGCIVPRIPTPPPLESEMVVDP